MRRGRRASAAAVSTLGRVRNPLWWRFFYWLLSRDAAVTAAAWLLRLLGRVAGPGFAEASLARFGELVWSGWPGRSRGWVNLDLSRFRSRLQRAVAGATATPPRPPSPVDGQRLRIGLVGHFSGLLTFSREHFMQAPDDVEIAVFDLEYEGRRAEYLAGAIARYVPLDAPQGKGYERRLARAAAEIDAADLDLLLIVLAKQTAYDLLDRVATPCIGYVCTGSEPLHHERVGFHVFCQPEADYFMRDGRLFCGTSRAWFGDPRAYEGFLVYDRRGIDLEAPTTAWAERDQLVFVHGSMYKVASPPFLDIVMGLLREDRGLELALIGKDGGGALDVIFSQARRYGVGGRVHHEGNFSPVRGGPRGEFLDPGWENALGFLRRARLAPDPWPIGGASSRVEAYALGAPTVHMRLRVDQPSWGRPQHALVDLPALLVAEGSATTIPEYRDLCRRCLYDEPFAERLVAAQLEVARRATDGAAYWRQIVELYGRWLSEHGDAAEGWSPTSVRLASSAV